MTDISRKYDLEERLISFAIRMLEVSELLNKTNAGNHFSGQLVRSGTSPAFNYGEAQAAESSKDFIHKMGIVLKELRETSICLKIIVRKPLIKEPEQIQRDLSECNELIAIFAKSIKTAKEKR
ncbi:MAG TPA: four helix bundle protein [Tenuifilaceae bacterium]|nr:four helix bundle protein [Tenuifilaceae bacterium]HPE18493.1 four helix bundle protein [Tenuifilaceae bacterium]HPJ46175.1 four helix bundle protein [Tenuifilaceae bacterium]HPQ34770.1 four helix bundle protein [Tenuifilaceae bacterium]HRX68150.1 four helix bundle protein [Tenuifilaceae bacterium]